MDEKIKMAVFWHLSNATLSQIQKYDIKMSILMALVKHKSGKNDEMIKYKTKNNSKFS
jgi:hypothetical protein